MSQGGFLVAPKPVPPLNIPASSSTVGVRVIDSTSKLTGHASMIIDAPMVGHDLMQSPAYSFLIEHPSGRNLLYDLGTRKDWKSFSPAVLKLLEQHDLGIEVQKSVSEILQENGIDVAAGSVEAIIWSHWHYDHIGDPSTFPTETALIVGPGFKEAVLPGHPAGRDSVILESDYAGRELRELEFDASRKIGGFEFIDYFGDGSFYILNAPGHALAHLCALARVTSGGTPEKDTFIFMGGDACHHGGEFRPTEYLPLPHEIVPSPFPQFPQNTCPGAWLLEIHRNKRADEPFYCLRKGFSYNEVEVEETIRHMEVFDGADNVLVIIAHDPSLLDAGFPMFPAEANGWRGDDFATKVHWRFLKDFKEAVKELDRD